MCQQFVVLRGDTLDQVHYGRDAKKWLSDIKFSPDGSLLAVSSHDCKVIYVIDDPFHKVFNT